MSLTALQKEDIEDAFQRVGNHYQTVFNALIARDRRIGLKELAASLRHLTELKKLIDATYPSKNFKIIKRLDLKKIPAHKMGLPYMFLTFEAGVLLPFKFAGLKIKFPDRAEGVDFSNEFSFKRGSDGQELNLFYSGEGAPLRYDDIKKASSDRIGFTQWMDHAPLSLAYLENGTSKVLAQSVSREQIIKRIANIKGGSHAQTAADQDGNIYDGAIREIEKVVIDDFSLDYFLLLGIAQSAVNFAKSKGII